MPSANTLVRWVNENAFASYGRLDLVPPLADRFIVEVAPIDYGPILPSRPGESHPEALTDSGREPLDSSGSCHRMKTAVFRHDPSGPPVSGCPTDPDAGDLPPSLHRNYPASPLLRSSPPLAGASLLSASRFSVCAFSVTIAHQVLKFRTKARMRFTLPIHRTPHGQ